MAATTLINSPLVLIRQHGIHRGQWTLSVNFHVQGKNIRATDPDGQAFPGALVDVQGVGIREVEVPDSLTVDAAAVNPAPKIVTAGTPRK